MESTASRRPIDVAAPQTRPGLALALALLSVPLSTLTWDTLPGGGFVWGCPVAIAAVLLGVQARQDPEGRAKAIAAIVIAGLMLAMVVVWTTVAVVTD